MLATIKLPTFLGIVLLAVAALALQDAPIPRHKPDGNPDHNNQPEWCRNWNDSMFKANCDCQPRGDDAQECKEHKDDDPDYMPTKCGTYCRRSACHCQSGCTT